MGDFRKLRAWHEAKRLAWLSKTAMRRLPDCERFSLMDQWRRCSYSVALNIAEGSASSSVRGFRRYLGYAHASLHELQAILELAISQGYLTLEEVSEVEASRSNCARMVHGLMQNLGKSS